VSVPAVWLAVAATGIGCYALKLAGLVMPQRVLDNPRVRRFTELVPVALLTALVAVQSLANGQALDADGPRLAGLGAAVLALLLRAPFLVVLITAATTTAALRVLT
jgi:branched-subunit amino acid transport protein